MCFQKEAKALVTNVKILIYEELWLKGKIMNEVYQYFLL